MSSQHHTVTRVTAARTRRLSLLLKSFEKLPEAPVSQEALPKSPPKNKQEVPKINPNSKVRRLSYIGHIPYTHAKVYPGPEKTAPAVKRKSNGRVSRLSIIAAVFNANNDDDVNKSPAKDNVASGENQGKENNSNSNDADASLLAARVRAGAAAMSPGVTAAVVASSTPEPAITITRRNTDTELRSGIKPRRSFVDYILEQFATQNSVNDQQQQQEAVAHLNDDPEANTRAHQDTSAPIPAPVPKESVAANPTVCAQPGVVAEASAPRTLEAAGTSAGS